ncbi:UDP-N-acetylmuramoyl-tripeptide--D-alanyl-D-alanine ligase [Enterococcus sp. BWT-B8]|uniref:UDP-N-acetylmuramoyl-tripeptide--D-alanyl-D- alanine ligase n=1 Tax=Enterococcus sp. BWT-B8 TaxID=2885157 RepID=UPI001E3F06F9|nr:UDP-N-acetylmuramoyl-tripeptide--D-alanyl-D-alanine ligase [Enterococcus sp. BWT-B8]MCB5952119.1 UDP-N-acetylmuramoyl-tripeptide--D-alanyl-D-alanine ligase [Enterococcus sp. BWT-B8]
MKLSFWEIAEATHGENNWQQWEDLPITGIEFDSRLIKEGNLFVPLSGTNDGHLFADQAVANGAVAAFWSSNEKAPEGLGIIEVSDTLEAMQQLAIYYLKKLAPSVIGITGSNGKTTTKDMTEAVLSQKFQTYKTQGNYNNEIGLPYTILHMPDDTEKLILEMGMDHAGEVRFLSKLAQPDVAAITMIGEAHIEHLGSREGIAAAKMEIVEGLKTDGLLMVPNEEPLLEDLTANLTQTVEKFGWSADAFYQGETIETGKEQTIFKVSGSEEVFSIPLPGNYNVTNALIAIGIGRWFGLSYSEIQAGLKSFNLTKNRTEWLKSMNGLEILSDVYNANPTAMKLVVDNFRQMPINSGGKRVAVLGDMLELGPESKEMHRSVGEYLNPEEIAEVFLYGSEMYDLYRALEPRYGKKIHYYPKNEKDSMIRSLKSILTPLDMVVLKGSNGMGLSEVVTALLNEN